MGILYQAGDPIYWVIWLFALFALMAFNELGRVKLWCGSPWVRACADRAHPVRVARNRRTRQRVRHGNLVQLGEDLLRAGRGASGS